MSDRTKIQWADATFNPWIGCTKVSPGCMNCYAENTTRARVLRSQGRETWGKGAARDRTSVATWLKPAVWNRKPWVCEECGGNSDRLYDHSCTGKAEDACHTANVTWHRQRVFPSLCDWLDDEVPIEWLADFLKLIYETPHLDWLLLTKRPENFFRRITQAQTRRGGIIDEAKGDSEKASFAMWLEFWRVGAGVPSNVWIGVSCEDQSRADERVLELLKIPAALRFLSVEPMLGPIEFGKVNWGGKLSRPILFDIDWCIIGGESGGGARALNVDWVRSLVKQCQASGTKCFVKQLGKSPVWSLPNPSPPPTAEEELNFRRLGFCRTSCADGRVVWQQFYSLKDAKGGDPAEWPEDLRVREFPLGGGDGPSPIREGAR